jgi:putative transcriptional regulator
MVKLAKNKSLQNKLAALRAQNKLSQDCLAKQILVSRGTINSIEKGLSNPSLELAMRLSKVFSLPVDEIFYYETSDQDR